MLRHYRDGAWHGVSWGEFARRAASVARGLRAAGVAAGDRVLIVSESRPEVPILETALMAIRAVPVPAYTTNTAGGPRASAARQRRPGRRSPPPMALAERVQAGAKLVAGLDALFCMQPGCVPLIRANSRPTRRRPTTSPAEAEQIPPGALACLIYTSGTSGLPRGVMTAAPGDPVQLPRRVRAGAAAASAKRDLSLVPAAVAQLRAHGRPVLPAQPRHRDRLFPRGRASAGRPGRGAADHPDRWCRASSK